MLRSATLTDLLSINRFKRRQRMLRLNPPHSLVQPDAHVRDLWRSQIPFRPKLSFVYVYVERGVVLGYVQVTCRWNRQEEWTITTIGAVERAPEHVLESLVEEVCRQAGEEGVLRIFVKVPQQDSSLELFHGVGFTHYTDENIWGNLYFSQPGSALTEPKHDQIRRQRSTDSWELFKLYSAVTPPAVQRAENLNSREWQRASITPPSFLFRGPVEKSYVWQDEGGGQALGGYIWLLSGKGGHWITLMFRSDAVNRSVVPGALDYVLWKASRQSNKPVYCGVREYQVEIESDLESRGFHLLSKQTLLVKYMAEPIKAPKEAMLPFLVPKTPVASR